MAALLLLLLGLLSLSSASQLPGTTSVSVTNYGATGDGHCYDTAAIQSAIDDCAAAGGGRVRFPAGGRYLTRTVHLRSGVVLEVEPGAAVLGGTRQEDYPPESSRWYVVLAENVTGAGITGGGTIDGQGGEFIVRPYVRKNVMVSWNQTGDCLGDECRPRLVGFIDSKDVRVWDVTLNQPAYWWPKPMDKSLFVAPGELRRGHRHGKNIVGISSDAILIPKESPSKRKSGVANVEEPSSTCTGSKESGSAQIEENFSGEKNEDKSIVGNSSKRLRVRGINKCKKVLEMEKGKKINVKFFNSRVVNNGNFSRYIGKLVRSRSICPLNVQGWEDISEAQKEHMWACVKDKFQCDDEDIEIHCGDVLKHMKSLWKNFRADLYRHYVKDKLLQDAVKSVPPGVDENDWKWLVLEHFGGSKFQKNSIQNRKNRSKVTMPHRTGSKPFRDIIYDMGGKDGNPPPITTLFYETRKKDDKLVDKSAIKKYDEMLNLKESEPSISDEKLLERCFGAQSHGYVTGFGGGVTRKNLLGLQSTREKTLLDALAQKEEENKKLHEKIVDLDAKVQFLMDKMGHPSQTN